MYEMSTPSRRTVLKATGASVVGLAASNPVAAVSGLVEVNVGYSAESGRKAALNAADEVVREFNFDALTIRAEKRAVTGLRSRSGIRYVEANGTMEALAETLPWGVDRLDAEVAHANGYTGKGAHVAIIDTGIDSDHPDLQDYLGVGHAEVSCNSWYSECYYDWDDDNDHGTHCAGIAAADNNSQGVLGVAPDATLHAVKVLDHNGSGYYSDIAAGIEYVADQGWDIANLSLGGSASSTVKDAVQYAYNNGVLLVASAGNDGPCTDCVSYPAAYQECVAVTAMNQYDDLSSFSSTGPEVEFTAPGEDIYSTVRGGYDTFSGTSAAAPYVSGTAALLMGDAFDYTNVEARDRLCNTAENVGLASNESGCGLVDAAAAVGCNSQDN